MHKLGNEIYAVLRDCTRRDMIGDTIAMICICLFFYVGFVAAPAIDQALGEWLH